MFIATMDAKREITIARRALMLADEWLAKAEERLKRGERPDRPKKRRIKAEILPTRTFLDERNP